MLIGICCCCRCRRFCCCCCRRLTTTKGMAEVKAGGRYRQEGKSYVVEDGDIIHFQFNVTTKKK